MTLPRTTGLSGLLVVLFAVTLPPSAEAQQKEPAGPPEGLGVQVLNTPLPITGTVTGNVTATITPTMYFSLSKPTCDISNRCSVTFPEVPAGKILRVTHIHGNLFNTNAPAFVALDMNNFDTNVFVRQLAPFAGAYLGATLSFNEATDVVFEAGQIPIIEVGSTVAFNQTTFNRVGITGELLDVAP